MIALLVGSIACFSPPADEKLLERIKSEAVPSWKRMARHAVSGKGRIRNRNLKATSGEDLVTFQIGGGLVSASAYRTSTSSWLSWSITTPVDRHLAPVDANGNTTAESLPGWAEQSLFDVLSAPYCIYGVPIFKLLDDPRFVVTSAERVVHDGAERVKLTFRQDGEQSTEARRFYTEGSCLLDERQGWRVTEFTVHNPAYKHPAGQVFDAKMKRAVEYAESSASDPVVKSLSTVGDDGKPTESWAVDFTPMPAETISHPRGMFRHPAFWILAIVGVIATFFVLRRRRRSVTP